MCLVRHHTLMCMGCPNRLLKPSSMANFQAVGSNQCLEPLVCSYYQKKRCCGHTEASTVQHLHNLQGEKVSLRNFEQQKKWDYRVAKWHQFRMNRGSLRTAPRETGNSTRQGNSSPGGRAQCGLQLRRASGKNDLPEVVAAPEQFTQKL